jgi:hypothetical protein
LFFKTEAKDLPHPLIKKELRVAFTKKRKEDYKATTLPV